MKRSVSPLGAKVKRVVGGRGAGIGKKSFRPLTPEPRTLLHWYDQNRRILPWRALPNVTPDPYHVWLSEIMLQQTTVATVGPYYQKFLKRWPTLRHLAKAKIDDVLREWAGLGYYRRAHGLHACAKRVCADYGGVFPTDAKELLNLPGFGPYTVAAVTAIAFGQRANVVDGNVERVMARLFAIQTPMPKAKKELREAAAQLLPQDRCGDYAQALMDLGATICTPRNPKCGLCPWQKACRARALDIAEQLPRKEKTAAKPLRRAIAFVLYDPEGRIYIRKRQDQGLLGGMMEVPSSAWEEGAVPSLRQVEKQAPIKAKWMPLGGIVRHVFSHFTLEVSVVVATTKVKPKGGRFIALDKLENEALPSLMHKIMRHVLKAV